jgi:hypothetical protein
MAVTTQRAVSQIIGHDQNDVGMLLGKSQVCSGEQEEQISHGYGTGGE